jgi:hypothetical protein
MCDGLRHNVGILPEYVEVSGTINGKNWCQSTMQQMYIEFDKTFVDQPLGGQRDEQKE